MSASTEIFAGIDVAKPHLDLALWGDPRSWRFPNDPEGIDALAQQLLEFTPTLIAIEATGGYEQATARHLGQAGLPLAIVSPRRVRDFARAKGLLAKTDRLDAHNLAHFAQAVRPHSRPAVSDAQVHLGGLVSRRRQLLQMLTAERNRLRNVLPDVHSHLQAHIAWLRRAIQELDAEIEALLRNRMSCDRKPSSCAQPPPSVPSPPPACSPNAPNWGPWIARRSLPLLGSLL